MDAREQMTAGALGLLDLFQHLLVRLEIPNIQCYLSPITFSLKSDLILDVIFIR